MDELDRAVEETRHWGYSAEGFADRYERYRPHPPAAASASATELEESSADIVTCSQSLQWMEPEPTFAEIARILRPGGVFAAYEYRWTLTSSAEADATFAAAHKRKGILRGELGLDAGHARWPVSGERLSESGRFGHVTETVLHSVEQVDAERLVGFFLSEGSTTTLLAAGVSEREIGIDRLREAAAAGLGYEPSSWYLGYRVVVGRC